MVSDPHPEGARGAHHQERDLPAVLQAGRYRRNAGRVSFFGGERSEERHGNHNGWISRCRAGAETGGGGEVRRTEKARLAELGEAMKDMGGVLLLHTCAGGSLPFFCKYRSKCTVRGERWRR